MRTRSSRLFLVLLHLVSVSTDIVFVHNPNGGIGDVMGKSRFQNMQEIILQHVYLPEGGLDELLSLERKQLERYRRRIDAEDEQPKKQTSFALKDPFWLQDHSDGLCLSPVGFSECSENTLWYIREYEHLERANQNERALDQRRRSRRQYGLSSSLASEVIFGHALQYVEPTSHEDCLQNMLEPRTRRRWRRRARQDHLPSNTRTVSQSIAPCHSSPRENVFAWTLDGHGVLQTGAVGLQSIYGWDIKSSNCLWRSNGTVATLEKCPPFSNDGVTRNGDVPLDEHDDMPSEKRRLAYLSLRRYIPAAVARDRQLELMQITSFSSTPVISAEEDSSFTDQIELEVNSAGEHQDDGEHIPRSLDSARRHASEPLHRIRVKSPSALIMAANDPTAKKTKLLTGTSVKMSTYSTTTTTTPKSKFFTLQDTNPILFIGGQGFETTSSTSPAASSSSSSISTATYKLRRLETHPYLKVAKNNAWTDPQTGLEYPTDLCSYLGHDVKKAGRHTLTGLGYYTKTVLNIKIYGVALYISKKDALADVVFEQFAARSADELRQLPEFYDHLREMPSPLNPKAGLIDRTLLLKLNMQLSMETMQSSLRATWKLLTEERKSLLINSSMKARPADERMLQTIKSPGNPGRCSCGQVAPPEYNADRDCCARGTELVFTWRKNGDLEIRVNGRIVDTFPRPDVARGIFYEYLRTDDPIAPDFSYHVVDGFPFLLGPLAQVKGMHTSGSPLNDAPFKQQPERGLGKLVSHLTDTVAHHGGEFFGWVHQGATGVLGHVTNAADSVGSTFNSVKGGFDRRRDEIWDQICTFPDFAKHIIVRKIQMSRRPDDVIASVAHYMSQRGRSDPQLSPRMATGPRGRVFRSSVSHWLGSSRDIDAELGNSTMYFSLWQHIIFFNLVHLYLLLLLVVSLPGRHQIKLVVPRRSNKIKMDESSSAVRISVDVDDEDDASTASSSSDDSPTRHFVLSSDNSWTIGNDPICGNSENANSNNYKRQYPKSIFRDKASPSRSQSRHPIDHEIQGPSSLKMSGMKKSLSYYL